MICKEERPTPEQNRDLASSVSLGEFLSNLLTTSAFLRFDYYGTNIDDMMKVKKALFMFIDLFGLEKFDYNTLV